MSKFSLSISTRSTTRKKLNITESKEMVDSPPASLRLKRNRKAKVLMDSIESKKEEEGTSNKKRKGYVSDIDESGAQSPVSNRKNKKQKSNQSDNSLQCASAQLSTRKKFLSEPKEMSESSLNSVRPIRNKKSKASGDSFTLNEEKEISNTASASNRQRKGGFSYQTDKSASARSSTNRKLNLTGSEGMSDSSKVFVHPKKNGKSNQLENSSNISIRSCEVRLERIDVKRFSSNDQKKYNESTSASGVITRSKGQVGNSTSSKKQTSTKQATKKQTRKQQDKRKLELMMKNDAPKNEFIMHEIILATIPGYSPWPARITKILGETIFVEFFGTEITSSYPHFKNPVRSNAIRPIEISKMIPFLQRKGYKKAVTELEMVLGIRNEYPE